MTPRTFWDRMQPTILWEELLGSDAVRPLTDEDGNVLGEFERGVWWSRTVVERLYGPLIGAA